MALYKQAAEKALSGVAIAGAGIDGPIVRDIKQQLLALLGKEFATIAWSWFNAHKDDVLYTINQRVWFFNVKFAVKVSHARRLLEELAGPEPLT